MRQILKRIRHSAVMVIFGLAMAPQPGYSEDAEAANNKAGGLPEWVQIQGRLATLRTRVEAKEKTVNELIEAKGREKDPSRQRELVKSLTQEHKELQTTIVEYEEVRNLLRYRFPEKGMTEDRSYQRIESRSLEQMENQVGIDGQISKTMSRMRGQYGEPAKDEPQRAPASPGAEFLSEEKRRILEPVMVSK